jgi:hypothetical protein
MRARQAVSGRDGGADFQDTVRVYLVLLDIFAHELQLEGVSLRVELDSLGLKKNTLQKQNWSLRASATP